MKKKNKLTHFYEEKKSGMKFFHKTRIQILALNTAMKYSLRIRAIREKMLLPYDPSHLSHPTLS